MIAEAEEREIKSSGSRNQKTSKFTNDMSKSRDKYDDRQSKNESKYCNKSYQINENKKDLNIKRAGDKTMYHHENRKEDSNKKNNNNSRSQIKSFKKPKGSGSDSSDDHDNYKEHRKSSDKHKKNRVVEPSDRSRVEADRHGKKYGKDKRKKHSKKQRSSSSSSESGDSSSESDESNYERSRCTKYDKKYNKSDSVSKYKQDKKRHESSLTSSSEDGKYDKKSELYDGKRKDTKRTFIRPHHDSDDDSFTRSNRPEKLKSYSSSSSKGWRKKSQTPKQEDVVECNVKEVSPVKESRNVEKEILTLDVEKPKILTDKEMNDLGAKLVKAELLGNQVCKVFRIFFLFKFNANQQIHQRKNEC